MAEKIEDRSRCVGLGDADEHVVGDLRVVVFEREPGWLEVLAQHPAEHLGDRLLAEVRGVAAAVRAVRWSARASGARWWCPCRPSVARHRARHQQRAVPGDGGGDRRPGQAADTAAAARAARLRGRTAKPGPPVRVRARSRRGRRAWSRSRQRRRGRRAGRGSRRARLARAWRAEHQHGVLGVGGDPAAAGSEPEERAAALPARVLAHRLTGIRWRRSCPPRLVAGERCAVGTAAQASGLTARRVATGGEDQAVASTWHVNRLRRRLLAAAERWANSSMAIAMVAITASLTRPRRWPGGAWCSWEGPHDLF